MTAVQKPVRKSNVRKGQEVEQELTAEGRVEDLVVFQTANTRCVPVQLCAPEKQVPGETRKLGFST